jgi:uncharacterized Zn-binding protein involved in type VI secretion
MGAPAARVGDQTAHGGLIIMGFPLVLIEGKPAARLGDLHVCPQATIAPVPVPHVGGPILGPCEPTVLIGGQPAARVSDWLLCLGPIDVVAMGAVKTQVGMPAPAPPSLPFITTPGGGGGVDVWAVNHAVVVNVGGVWNGVVAVAIAAGALGVLAVAIVVYPFVSRSFAAAPEEEPGGSAEGFDGEWTESELAFMEGGMRDDAPVYFL